MMALSIPLTAIIGVTYAYVKTKKLASDQLSASEKKEILDLKNENIALQQRLQNLETIVSVIDVDALKLNSRQNQNPDLKN
ncbi:MAG: hypothetical protein EAZ97_07565 [Bacteroidetes bacterium]|nr:MAG: hypothetical protein EAZ97_07565 [Bacteroidota bacterium]